MLRPIHALVLLPVACGGGAPPPAPRPPAPAASAEPEPEDAPLEPPRVTHGAMVGDVRADSAQLWVRADSDALMDVRVVKVETGESLPVRELPAELDEASDFAATVALTGLEPATRYRFEARLYAMELDDGDEPMRGATSAESLVHGELRTAPAPDSEAAVQFAWSGDLGGQNVCRDADAGYAIFDAIADESPDFFVGLGDMIYADGKCEAVGRYGNRQVPGDFGPAASLAEYRAHWRYNRSDAAFQRLLQRAPYFAVWDDHEVVNDFGPKHDTRSEAPYTAGEHLMPLGLRALLEWHPIETNGGSPSDLHRSFRFGRHLELILLDARQYRDPNSAPDDAAAPKTMLGEQQRRWLGDLLERSDATWKIVACSVPISIPTGYPVENGRDGWADHESSTGFERELGELMARSEKNPKPNFLWITTDVHFAAVVRHAPSKKKPRFHVLEAVVGPLSAGLFPRKELDETFRPTRLFYHGPESADAVTTHAEALKWLSYGTIRIDESGALVLAVKGHDGRELYAQRLQPEG